MPLLRRRLQPARLYQAGPNHQHRRRPPRSPISHGGLCPKGANTLQLVANAHRVTKVRYRAPFSDHWEDKPLDWALDRIAQLVKETRDADFVEHLANGITVNYVKTIASLGGSANDNEEVYLMKKLLTGGLGILPVKTRPGSDTLLPCPVWAHHLDSAPAQTFRAT